MTGRNICSDAMRGWQLLSRLRLRSMKMTAPGAEPLFHNGQNIIPEQMEI